MTTAKQVSGLRVKQPKKRIMLYLVSATPKSKRSWSSSLVQHGAQGRPIDCGMTAVLLCGFDQFSKVN